MSETWDVIFHRVCVWECCFESNASCFIILVHDVRFGCQWYGSRGWTFPPVFHCILLLCDSSLRGSRGAFWHGSMCETKVWNWITPGAKNGTHWHSLTLAECLWKPNCECEHSEVVGGTFQQWCHHSSCETVGQFHWHRFLQAWHANSCWLLVKTRI